MKGSFKNEKQDRKSINYSYKVVFSDIVEVNILVCLEEKKEVGMDKMAMGVSPNEMCEEERK